MSDMVKTLQATLKFKDEMTKDIQNTVKALQEFKKNTDTTSKALKDTEKASKNTGDAIEETGNSAQESKGGIAMFKDALEKFKKLAIVAALKKIIDKIVELGKKCVDAAIEVKTGYNEIVKATGATGTSLQGLQKNFDNVYSSMPVESTEELGQVIGEVNTRFGFTGKTLETATKQFTKFNKITGLQGSEGVRVVARAMGDAGVKADEYQSVLDALASASQASGIATDELAEKMVTFGAPLRAFGLKMQDSVALFATWEKAGVNTTTAISGMKIALGQWAKEGKDATTEFSKACKKIKSFKTDSEAAGYAAQVFGQRAGSDLADAIRGGRFDIDEMNKVLKKSGGTVNETYKNTQGAVGSYTVMMQNIKLCMKEIGNVILSIAGPAFKGIGNAVKGMIPFFKTGAKQVQKFIKTFQKSRTCKEIMAMLGEACQLLGGLFQSVWPAISAALNLAWTIIRPILRLIVATIRLIISAIRSLKPIWDAAWAAISGAIEAAWTLIKPVLDGICDLLSDIVNWVKSVIDWWKDLAKLFEDPITAKVEGQSFGSGVTDGLNDLRTGGNKKAFGQIRVPRDDTPYMLHEGERILTKQQAERYNSGNGVAEIKINIQNMQVREEADITKVAEKLYDKLSKQARMVGGV